MVNGIRAAGAYASRDGYIIRRSQRIPRLRWAPTCSQCNLLLLKLIHIVCDFLLNVIICRDFVSILIARFLLLKQLLLLLHQRTGRAVPAGLRVLALHRIIFIPLRLLYHFGGLLQLFNLWLHLLDLVLLRSQLLRHLHKYRFIILCDLQTHSLQQIIFILRNLRILGLI